MQTIKRSRTTIRVAALLCLAGAVPSVAHAQDKHYGTSADRFFSHEGNVLFLAGGVLRALLTEGGAGRQQSLRTADTLLTSAILSESLKHLVRERRPDGSNRLSFPSGHATAAFAIAAMESHYHRNEAPYWYLGAALISASRVRLHRHYIHDVLAGGILGIATAETELHQPRGLVLSPFIRPESGERGLMFQARF